MSGDVHDSGVRLTPDIPDDGPRRFGAEHAGVGSFISYFVIF